MAFGPSRGGSYTCSHHTQGWWAGLWRIGQECSYPICYHSYLRDNVWGSDHIHHTHIHTDSMHTHPPTHTQTRTHAPTDADLKLNSCINRVHHSSRKESSVKFVLPAAKVWLEKRRPAHKWLCPFTSIHKLLEITGDYCRLLCTLPRFPHTKILVWSAILTSSCLSVGRVPNDVSSSIITRPRYATPSICRGRVRERLGQLLELSGPNIIRHVQQRAVRISGEEQGEEQKERAWYH